jgi:ornithine carbamoyltransferase
MLKDYQVNEKAFSYAKKDAIFLHCLPAFHDLNTDVARDNVDVAKEAGMDITNGIEVSDSIFRSDRSKVMDQAENRMHTIKAIMFEALK